MPRFSYSAAALDTGVVKQAAAPQGALTVTATTAIATALRCRADATADAAAAVQDGLQTPRAASYRRVQVVAIEG